MTVKELKEILLTVDDDTVLVVSETDTAWGEVYYNVVEEVNQYVTKDNTDLEDGIEVVDFSNKERIKRLPEGVKILLIG